MDLFQNLIYGFSVSLTLQNILYCFIGCLAGTLVGVLPGVGPLATIAMLLPITFTVPPIAAMIMLAGIYYGAMYGGSTTSILVNLPEKPRRWLPASTAIRWHGRAAPGRRLRSQHWARSLPEPRARY